MLPSLNKPGYSYVILCKANPLRGKTFMVREENLHAWETLIACFYTHIANQQGRA